MKTNKRILLGLEPAPVFRFFEEICGIPHGSSNTKAISDYCVQFAKEHSLRYIQDSLNNVIIFKEGTEGYENSSPVILQGHLDMVCEKEKDCTINFSSDGLRLRLDEGVISAEGTTLGGDDGIAVAYMLALLDATDIPHPPLEAIFTVDEEIGMLGAAALDTSPLKGRMMLNIDSEEEGFLLAGCAGGVSVTSTLPIETIVCDGTPATIQLSGLTGGHSGVEIDKGRANACMLMGRTLYELRRQFDFRLVSVNGGQKDNAIPRECTAKILLSGNFDAFSSVIAGLSDTYRAEYSQTDPSLQLTSHISNGSLSTNAMLEGSTTRIITALVNMPCGVQRMSSDIEGLVQTSLNLGILKTETDIVSLTFAVRSSLESEKREVTARILSLTEMLAGNTEENGDYPAWEYRRHSPLRDRMTEVFYEQYGKKPVIQTIHAGLECGLFSGKLPGLDCISYGPDMKDIHTPKERLYADSVLRTWNFTCEVLKRLK